MVRRNFDALEICLYFVAPGGQNESRIRNGISLKAYPRIWARNAITTC
jgi:hypothetical protein